MHHNNTTTYTHIQTLYFILCYYDIALYAYIHEISRLLWHPNHEPSPEPFCAIIVLFYMLIFMKSQDFYYTRPMTQTLSPFSILDPFCATIMLFCKLIIKQSQAHFMKSLCFLSAYDKKISRVLLVPSHEPNPEPCYVIIILFYILIVIKSQDFYNPRTMNQPRAIL